MPLDSDWLSRPGYVFQMPQPTHFTVTGEGGKILVSIDLATGAIEFGEGFSADEAAREAWLVMAKAYNSTCKPAPVGQE